MSVGGRGFAAKRAFFQVRSVVSSLTVADLRLSTLGGLLRQDEILQGAWGRRDCAASRPRRPRAWGNIGAVAWGMMFKFGYIGNFEQGYIAMGYIIIASSVFTIFMRIKGQSSVLCGDQ